MEPLLTPSNELTRFAMACLPHEYRSSAHPRLLKAGPSGNAVMQIGTGRRKFVVKIYRRPPQASSLLPNPQQCAAKDVWISLLPELKQLVPRIYFAEATHFGDEPISIAVHEYVKGEPATSVNVSVEQINRFAIHLGEICAKVNVTQVHGYGALLIPTSSTFDKPTWNDYVRQRLDATPEELLTTRQSSGSENHKLILSTLLTSRQDGPAELFHHDLIHNWSNVLVDAKSGKPRYIIDWDQAGGGRSVIVDLAVARFALRFRSHAQFGWKKFLQQFLAGYGVSLHNYKDQTLAKVNALSALYAARAIQISPERAAQQSLYIEDALNHSDLG